MQTPIIRLSDVSLSFTIRNGLFKHHTNQILNSINIDISQGETLGLIGRNGCGKSTLLRLIAGVFTPDSGSIERHGARVSILSLAVGFDPELSGRDNILLSATLLGLSKEDITRNYESIVDFSELGEFIQQPVRIYSSGMRMRLGFAIAITMKPDVLLIDEALGVGDAAFRIKAENALSEKIRSNQTVVLVSHTSTQIARLCDRVLWLENGAICMQGEAQQVLDSYEQHLTISSKPSHTYSELSRQTNIGAKNRML
ncbi:MAG: hypothetical protein DHS20C01_32050 [marine bacterium B5-7]|nr:MAG: hypothetical protein DHS20C01_32050 [marine bacterium B5-7]